MGDVVRPDFRSKAKACEASLASDCGFPVKVYGFEGQYGVALYSSDAVSAYRQIELKLTELNTNGAYPIVVFMETLEVHAEAHAMAAAILHVLRVIKYIER